MKDRYIAPAVMLLAGAVMSIVNIINHETLLVSLLRVFLVLIGFFILGKIAAAIIRKATNEKQAEDKGIEDTEENTATIDLAEEVLKEEVEQV
ncbi:hypothetical protein R2R35_22645 [Anaerocolumna sp. AGMB13020]|uniref:hypothetical protein n=1 Tax=Anaerocolumna sp. AGMB13020 TaxID=3081750 RepID=UPI002954DD0A|nr:hypothetical protein [Anaerocolumna sp. AGMB13020]WOO36557.1 hypothetical protein R2R35_22645 [Anaerocolumna sp. AGMB13020]